MGKRYICWLLVFLLALPLTACGAAAPDQSTSAPAQSTSSPTETKELTWQALYDKGTALCKAWAEQWEDELLEEAVESFSAAIALEPGEISLLTARGDAYARLWNLDAAKADYEAALAKDETCAAAHLGLADLLIRQNQFDAALEMMEAVAVQIQDEAVMEKLAEMRDGNFYNSAGNPHWIVAIRDWDGTVIRYSEYIYDEGNTTSVRNYDGEKNPSGYTEYLTNEDGSTLGYDNYDLDGNYLDGMRYTWGENGQIARYTNLDANGDPIMSYSYVWDDKGNMVECCFYEVTGEITNRSQYEYDDQGNEVARVEEFFDDQGHCDYKERYEVVDGQDNPLYGIWYYFNENGYEYRRTELDRVSGKYILWFWQLDDAGNCEFYLINRYDPEGKCTITEIYSPEGEMEYYYTYRYSPGGRFIEKLLFNANGEPQEEPVYQVEKILEEMTP